MEAEYIVATEAGKGILWMKRLLAHRARFEAKGVCGFLQLPEL